MPGHHAKFPNLFKPLALNHGRIVLKNRVLMGSMHTGLEESLTNGKLEAMAAFYAERAKGEVGLCVTGGIAPNNAGRVKYMAAKLSSDREVERHRVVTDAVHANDGKIAMQILHTGRYAYHHWAVGPSNKRSPISMFPPKPLTTLGVGRTIDDFVKCAELATQAGYDGVEIMGSEGYLINEFISSSVNTRTDKWGGSYANRIQFPIEIVRRTREAVGEDAIIVFRLSMLDLVQGGSTFEEVKVLAQAIEDAGASIINTGIGWHEARIPTIATCVPRGGFAWVTKKLMNHVDIPLCATNRINTPHTAEQVISEGYSDMVSMARPLLADPAFMKKAGEDRADEINTCIGCNQACLDHVFESKRASCLVNPFAGYEKDLVLTPIQNPERYRVAVVGAGPAGLACSTTCAKRGIDTVLFERSAVIGGQFNLAKRIPGKEEFFETLRYFKGQLKTLGVDVRLNTKATKETLESEGFTHIVIATGVTPRKVFADHAKVVSYIDVLNGSVTPGEKVAIIGAGGVGFDVAEYLSDPVGQLTEECPKPGIASQELIATFREEWNIADTNESHGGVGSSKEDNSIPSSSRKLYLLQRNKNKFGEHLGKTTGWIHRTTLKRRNVEMIGGVQYDTVDDRGLHITVNDEKRILDVDHVVVCAGQESLRDLWDNKDASVAKHFLIGGSELASELDAKRAIDQGTRLALEIERGETGDVFNQPVTFSSKFFMLMRKLLRR
mmetsp:Transcript_9277/g.15075  ORF Transcript_9277/g.15075 Transcript_9277/m.15075 type:complete len:725 (-) Transcript_9277:1298-3472(-)|eukprot:CAMPEP_0203751324 /NCGR_PEP_ID=MMETSP0098-20131031/5414_1 /ASSEMBLY_ACC=CAM_ASM_000208 /TAXON_ID=96639 /ORGANISM=" , Strain NY0313808BC1" /LENGTH=724 /DNA_ID=CAMNT_0050640989 /DNA_START=17 /DNA_END=2191 /DNA_ORIENTATION=+